MNIIKCFDNCTLITESNCVSLSNDEWVPHKSFKGVYLKNIVKGTDAGNAISCHLVKIDPYCEIGIHAHENNMEIHEVVNGSGLLSLSGNNHAYAAGSVSVIPQSSVHSVKAGENGLYLLAKFIPALG